MTFFFLFLFLSCYSCLISNCSYFFFQATIMSFPLFKSWFSFSRLLSFSNFFLCSASIHLPLSPFLSLYLFFLPLNLFSFSCVILALFLSLVSLFFLFFCPPLSFLSLCHPLPIFSLLQYLLHRLSSPLLLMLCG